MKSSFASVFDRSNVPNPNPESTLDRNPLIEKFEKEKILVAEII
jgi:hypothetical protein